MTYDRSFIPAGAAIAFFLLSFWFIFFGSKQSSQKFSYYGYLVHGSSRNNGGGSVDGTKVENLVFGVGAGSGAWERRKNYVRLWWRPNETRGLISLDRAVQNMHDKSLPPFRVEDYTKLSTLFTLNGREARDHIRVSRLPSELFRLSFPDVHWFVLSDDDTFFVVDNLVKALSKYDHREFYYVGMFSESHHQSVKGFSTNMAFGGAGIALSYALVEALEKVQDDCIRRHYRVWGVDGKLQACMAELGVPLTHERGFHQIDLQGDITGFLGSHTATPLVSLHHIDVVNPIFPGMDRVKALEHLSVAIQADSAAILQQSFCYNRMFNWTLKVAWGYAVQANRGLISPRDLEHPSRTFAGWFGCSGELCFNFKTREIPGDPCFRSIMFFMSNVSQDGSSSTYLRNNIGTKDCHLRDPLARLRLIHISKEQSHYQAPRRQCCSISNPQNQEKHELKVSDCKHGEVAKFSG